MVFPEDPTPGLPDFSLPEPPPPLPPPKARPAGVLLRCGAMAFDAVAAAALWAAADRLQWRWGLDEETLRAVQAAGLTAYFMLAIAVFLRTPGQVLSGVFVLDSGFGGISRLRLLLRHVVFTFTLPAAPLNLFVMRFDERRRALHDLLCETWVIESRGLSRARRWAFSAAAVAFIAVSAYGVALAATDVLERSVRPSLSEIAKGK